MAQSLNAFCLPWHIEKSPAARLLLSEPMRDFARVDFAGWNGSSPLPQAHLSNHSPVVFFQLPPPQGWQSPAGIPTAWIPMWDSCHYQPESWWRAMPRSLKVVALCDAVAARAQAAGLRCLKLTYYPDPGQWPAASWSHGRILFYWNRTGLMSAAFLGRLARSLQVSKIVFRGMSDPGIDARLHYELPESLNGIPVESMANQWDQALYERCASQANIFVAPRVHEGVGLAFLEAMARGCAVFALNAPSMNDYIRNGQNGVLLSPASTPWIRRTLARIPLGRRFGWTRFFEARPRHPLDGRLDRRPFSTIDLKALGAAARQDCVKGHQAWRSQWRDYANFLLNV